MRLRFRIGHSLECQIIFPRVLSHTWSRRDHRHELFLRSNPELSRERVHRIPHLHVTLRHAHERDPSARVRPVGRRVLSGGLPDVDGHPLGDNEVAYGWDERGRVSCLPPSDYLQALEPLSQSLEDWNLQLPAGSVEALLSHEKAWNKLDLACEGVGVVVGHGCRDGFDDVAEDQTFGVARRSKHGSN